MILRLAWRIIVDSLAAFGTVVMLAGLFAHFSIPNEHPPAQDNIEFNRREDEKTD
ncbi:MAG TPA: hypothetical protein VFZ08_06335 [Terriglobia bacterium]|nr:hypothetical protein [Terriglobia bacterium]